MNDFRTQIALERGNYVLRDLHDRLESRMGEEVKSLDRGTDSRLKVLENLRSNLEGKIWMMGAAITGIMTFVQILLYVIHFYAYAATK